MSSSAINSTLFLLSPSSQRSPREVNGRPPERLVDSLALDAVADQSEEEEQEDGQHDDDEERDPVRLGCVHVLEVLDLGGEVAGHETDGQEEHRGFGEEDGGAGQFFDGLRFFEGD